MKCNWGTWVWQSLRHFFSLVWPHNFLSLLAPLRISLGSFLPFTLYFGFPLCFPICLFFIDSFFLFTCTLVFYFHVIGWEKKRSMNKIAWSLEICKIAEVRTTLVWSEHLFESLPCARCCCVLHILPYLILSTSMQFILLLAPFYEVETERLHKKWTQDLNPECLDPELLTIMHTAPYSGQGAADCWSQAW